jgi:LuxR family transcriptional regulator, maltose regulon positive regulatory protein
MATILTEEPRPLRDPELRDRWPQRTGGLVPRSVLYARLSGVRCGGVVLVCAPAGSGKSVLVRSWVEVERLADRVAWVTAVRGEHDGQRFWLSVVDALAPVVGSVQRVASAPGLRGQEVVDRLLRDLDAADEPVVLVIDDLHELRSADALKWLELFLARVPRQLLVVLATREDPRLGLHRLRLAGDLTELRGPDLRFSLEETRELLKAAGIALSEESATLLQERTEGWAAGLRLAAISLAQHPDPERFVTEFSGSERTVAGYLLAEVLERQPAEVRELLLRTSVLESVSGPLADFLTGNCGSEAILQGLQDANAFVTSLDARRSWFRYHQLFAELLQLELRRVSPPRVGALHRAAAEWYEDHGYAVEAVRHAQAAHDWPLASRLLADAYVSLFLDGCGVAVRELLDAFPSEAPAGNAELALVFALARLLDGAREESAGYLDLAQGLAETVPEQRRSWFEVQLAEVSLLLGRCRGDLGAVVEAMRSLEAGLAEQPARERANSDDVRAVALLNLGVAELWAGRPDDARRDLERALALAHHIGRPWLEISCHGHLGIAAVPTDLPVSVALQHSDEAVRIAETNGWDEDPVIVTALATGAMALLWLGHLDEGDAWLERALRLLKPDGEPATELIVHHARGLVRLAQRRLEEALGSFRAATRMQKLLADEHPLAAPTRARLLQTEAHMGGAAAARAAYGQIPDSERDTPAMRVTAAMMDLAQGAPEHAIEVLAPVIDGSARTIRQPWVIVEAQAFDAVAREQLPDRHGAEASLERALELAEPDGIVLPFVLAPVHGLLQRLPRYRTTHATLLRTILAVAAGSSRPPRREDAPLLEDLSEAEVRVVRYLPSNLKAPEIAAELRVSANTVRTHIRHIYAKLDSHDRNGAVARARDLGLLAPTARSR